MKKIIKVLLALMVVIGSLNISNAASYSFNFVGPTQANAGDTITLTITANGLTGKVNLSSTNATLSDSQKWVEKNSVSVTAKITGFPATITATPEELTDNDYNIVSLSARTVTVTEIPKQEEPKKEDTSSQTTTPPPTSNNNQGQSSQSAGSLKANQGTTSSTTGRQSPDVEVKNAHEMKVDDTESSNNYLKSLTVSAGTISPAFDRENTEYEINNVIENEIEIVTEAEDERAIISGAGTIAINPGENIVNIAVTAQNGAVKNYRLTVNKKQELTQSDLRLQTLEVKKINTDGEFTDVDIHFDKDIFDYKINVENNITDLDIIPTIEKEGIIVETNGQNNLDEGENDIEITLTNMDNTEEKTVYSIKAIRAAVSIQEEFEPIEKKNYALQIVAIIVLLATIISIIVYRRYKRRK